MGPRNATWETLGETYDTDQLMQATTVVGHHHLVVFAPNSFGVELDPGLRAPAVGL